MKRTLALITAAVLGTCSFTAATLAQHDAPKAPTMPKSVEDAAKHAQDALKGETKTDKKTDAAPAGSPTPEQMKAWMDAATPATEHQWLGKLAGEWDAVVKMFDPNMGASETKGTATSTVVLGGRFLQTNYKGEMMGQPFEGLGIMGFDNISKQFQSTWMDNFGTFQMHSAGTMNKDTHVMEMTSDFVCPMTRQNCKAREVYTFIDENHYSMTFFNTMTGKEEKCMEIHYTRKGAAPAATPAADKGAMDKTKEEAMKKAKDALDKAKEKLPTNH